MITINKEVIKTFDPCTSGWKIYLQHYETWEGSLKEFMYLTRIPSKDKVWLFSRPIQGLEGVQREFAFIVTERVVDKCNLPEIREFFQLILFIYTSRDLELLDRAAYRATNRATNRAAYRAAYRAANSAADWAAYRAAYSAAYSAADRAAYSAAYSAADRDIQVEIIKSLL